MFLQDRTNNFAEAAHRRLQLELGMDHPSLWKLIDGLRRVQKRRDVDYERMVAGHAPLLKSKKYVNVDKRIFNLVQRLNECNRPTDPEVLLEFLRGIAHNLEIHS